MENFKQLQKKGHLLIYLFVLILTPQNIEAQKLNNYQNATQVEKQKTKPQKNTSTQRNTSSKNIPKLKQPQKPKPEPKLSNYQEKTKKLRTQRKPSIRHNKPYSRKKRHFRRTRRRYRHYVPSFHRHRYHRYGYVDHYNYYHDSTPVIITNSPPIQSNPPIVITESTPAQSNPPIVITESPTVVADSSYEETYYEEPVFTSFSTPRKKLTETEIQHLNAQIDVYESREGLFKINGGMGSTLRGNTDIQSLQFNFNITMPPNYSPEGRNISTWGLGYEYRDYRYEEEASLHQRLYIEGVNTRLFNDFAHTWKARIGTKILSANSISAGLLFGIHYDLHNLNNIYTFHVGYDGILYNLGSTKFKTTWESNLESYFRIYIGPFYFDLGGELNIIDLESGDYFHQLFGRFGSRF